MIQSEATPLAAEQLAPHSVELEETLLALFLDNSDRFNEAVKVFHLRAEHFFMLRHQRYFEIMLTLMNAGLGVDFELLRERLTKLQQWNDTDTDTWRRIMFNVPFRPSLEGYCKLLKSYWMRRQIIAKSTDLCQRAQSEDVETLTIIEHGKAFLTNLESEIDQAPLPEIDEVWSNLYSRAERGYESGAVAGYSTGIKAWDYYMRLEPDTLNALMMRPGGGKTALSVSLALQLLLNPIGKDTPHRVGYYSGEMTSEQLLARMIASLTGIEYRDILRGNMTDDQWALFGKTSTRVNQWDMRVIHPSTDINIDELVEQVKRLHRIRHFTVFFVDYIGLLDMDANNMAYEISDAMRKLKTLASALNIPVIAAIQANREVDNRKIPMPGLNDAFGSSGIEQHCDTVTAGWRPYMYDKSADRNKVKDVMLMEVLKQRQGPTGPFEITMRMAINRMSEKE
jgi:replicative DNA helicase